MNDLPASAFSSNDADVNTITKRRFNPFKVEKAIKFLSLPEIDRIASEETKAAFLRSKGMNENEISEAFHPHKRLQCMSNKPGASQLLLNAVANEERGLVVYSGQKRSIFSTFFSFCQKFVLLAGITTTCYYFYQRWRRIQAEKKKTERAIKEELNQIKNEVRRIANELRQQDSVKLNQSALLNEINSLKEILVGRKHFEEIQNEKVTIPSWQLNKETNSTASSFAKAEVERTKVKLPTWQTNGSRSDEGNDFQSSTTLKSIKPEETALPQETVIETARTVQPENIPVSVSVLSEDEDPVICCSTVNGNEHEENQKITPEIVKKAIKNKKSEKKNQPS